MRNVKSRVEDAEDFHHLILLVDTVVEAISTAHRASQSLDQVVLAFAQLRMRLKQFAGSQNLLAKAVGRDRTALSDVCDDLVEVFK
ncbi:MAG: hypothetical protein AAF961_12975 [Planctomycetota bacterium]